MRRRFAAIASLVMATVASAQWLESPTPGIPRTPDGKPNLAAPTPRTADGRPELIGSWRPVRVTGDLCDPTKLQAWARTATAEHERTFYRDGPHMQCRGQPYVFMREGDGATQVAEVQVSGAWIFKRTQ